MSTIASSVAGASFAALAILVTSNAASAASPAYCALYAREYAGQFLLPAAAASGDSIKVQDQAYYRCLNLDEDPEFPETSAYFGADFEAILSGSDAAISAAEGIPDVEPAVEPKAEKSTQVASTGKPRRPGRGSGYDAWTPEWVEWCEANYRSFDPETGYVKTNSGTRKLCP